MHQNASNHDNFKYNKMTMPKCHLPSKTYMSQA